MPGMTTSQRVPRRALLRRVGPWVALAAILTGCASPATRTALSALDDRCGDPAMSTTAACQTLALMAEGDPAGDGGAKVLTASTGAADGGARSQPRREPRREATRRSVKPKARSEARVRDEPTPRRTSRRIPKVRMPAITASYFGGAVTVARFRITGDTRSQILRSIRTRGPHGGAQGVTQPYLRYRFTFKYDRKGRCRVVRTGRAAVTMSFRVTLPAWAATTGTDRSTASWWAAELRDTAAHERRHVRIWRGALRQANRVVARSSCGSVGRRLDAIWRAASIANCRYDASEYGISLRACLRR